MPDNVEKLKTLEATEPVASFLKMKLMELKPGYAKITMTVFPSSLRSISNFLGCHL